MTPILSSPEPRIACPWCGSEKIPVPTKDFLDVANFRRGSANDPAHVAKNPAMCPDCLGVGGLVDWGFGQ